MNTKSTSIALGLGLALGLSFSGNTPLQPERLSAAQPAAEQVIKRSYNCRTREVWNADKQAWCQKVEQLKNATYQIPKYGSVKMTNGRFERDASTGERWSAGVAEIVVFDDFNGDKVEDAAVVVWVNSGGSGQFKYLAAVQDVARNPQNVSTVLLGDRVTLTSLSADQGRIALTLITQKPNEPLCCPTQKVSQTYVLQNKQLELFAETLTSTNPEPLERNQYTPIDLKVSTQANPSERDNYTPIDLQAIKPTVSLTGRDPRTIALAAFGLKEKTEPSVRETITVNTINPQQAIVYITQLGLADDSIRGFRYRVEFEATTNAGQPEWRMTWAGKQNTCWKGRGSQDWTTKLCQ
jgi:hypothetical protein